MTRSRAVLVISTALALVAVIAVSANPQRGAAPTDPVAQEVRELRLAVERAAALSAQVTLAAQQANAVQGRISSVSWELADVRSQVTRASAEFARYNAIVMEFERDFPAAVKEPAEGLRLPQYGQYLQAKSQVEGQRQLEQDLRLRASELTTAVSREQEQWNQLTTKLQTLERSLAGQRN